jgi:hypothetical protein
MWIGRKQGVELRELLAAVNPLLGVVDIKQDASRHRLEAVAEQLDHQRHHTFERGRAACSTVNVP